MIHLRFSPPCNFLVGMNRLGRLCGDCRLQNDGCLFEVTVW